MRAIIMGTLVLVALTAQAAPRRAAAPKNAAEYARRLEKQLRLGAGKMPEHQRMRIRREIDRARSPSFRFVRGRLVYIGDE